MQKPKNYNVVLNYRATQISEEHKSLLREVFNLNDQDINDRTLEAEFLQKSSVYTGPHDIAETKAMLANDWLRENQLQSDTIFTVQALG